MAKFLYVFAFLAVCQYAAASKQGDADIAAARQIIKEICPEAVTNFIDGVVNVAERINPEEIAAGVNKIQKAINHAIAQIEPTIKVIENTRDFAEGVVTDVINSAFAAGQQTFVNAIATNKARAIVTEAAGIASEFTEDFKVVADVCQDTVDAAQTVYAVAAN